MSSPSTPEPATALAPQTPEREITLLSVDRDSEPEHHISSDLSRKLASLILKASMSTPSTSSPSLVTLVSAVGHRLTVPRRVAKESGTVRQLLLSRDDDADGDPASSSVTTIPLPAILGRELASILQFCERQLQGKDELDRIRAKEKAAERKEEEQARARKSSSEGGTKPGLSSSGPSPASLVLAVRAAVAADAAAWATSTGGSRGLLGRTLAANYLDVPAALSACVDAVASGIRGRSPAEIRARFGIAPDLSKAEEEAIKADCAWAFDCC